jgi:uncharacterized integral membrane protein
MRARVFLYTRWTEGKMAWKWILIVTILILVIIFTAQNYEPVQIKFLAWSFKSSSALTIFVSLVIGFLIGLLMCVRKD